MGTSFKCNKYFDITKIIIRDPNISSPANREAAILYSEDRSKYNEKAKIVFQIIKIF